GGLPRRRSARQSLPTWSARQRKLHKHSDVGSVRRDSAPIFVGNSSEDIMTTGMLTLAQLKKEVGNGAIDTVVAAFPDMQGRLMGKRFHAQYFIEGAYEETHGCNYLLAD